MLQQSTPFVPAWDSADTDVGAWSVKEELASAIQYTAPLLVPWGVQVPAKLRPIVESDASTSYDEAVDVLNGGAEAIAVRPDSGLMEALGADVVSERVLVVLRDGEELNAEVQPAGLLVEGERIPSSESLKRYVHRMNTSVSGRGAVSYTHLRAHET